MTLEKNIEMTKQKTWFLEVAQKIIKQNPNKNNYNIATWITPSGFIHMWNLRELLTWFFVQKWLETFDKKTKLYFFVDDFDPLRKIYPFLDETYQQYIGNSISSIPAPFEDKDLSYADYFIKDFKIAIKRLWIDVTFIKASELYLKWKYNTTIKNALIQRKQIIELLSKTWMNLNNSWYPILVKCDKCQSLNTTTIHSIDLLKKQVEYSCKCGNKWKKTFENWEAKLKWRVEWPYRQKMFDIDIEPFGKDHATKWWSFDSGKYIHQHIFNDKIPYPIIYQWIKLSGKWDMSSSKWITISAKELTKILPPEVIKYYFAKYKPNQWISFSIENDINKLLKEYQKIEKQVFEEKTKNQLIEILWIKDKKYREINFEYLAIIINIYWKEDIKLIKEKLWIINIDNNFLKDIINYSSYWSKKYFSNKKKINLISNKERKNIYFNEEEIRILINLEKELISIEWDIENIKEIFFRLKESLQLENTKQIYQTLYKFLFNKTYWPNLSHYLYFLEKDKFINFIKQNFN